MIELKARIFPEDLGEWLSQRIRAALPRALEAAMDQGLKAARARLNPGGGGPVSRSSRLSRSIATKVVEAGWGAWKGQLYATVVYAPVHEFGATIRPRLHPYLLFQVHGQWIRKPQVRIPPRPFLHPGLRAAAEAFREMMAQAIARELKK